MMDTRQARVSKVQFSGDTTTYSTATRGNLPPKAAAPPPLKTFTVADVERMKHENTKRYLLIIHEKLYDVTAFRSRHPGGQSVFDFNNGQDVTETFDSIHGSDMAARLQEFLIGRIVTAEEQRQQQQQRPQPLSPGVQQPPQSPAAAPAQAAPPQAPTPALPELTMAAIQERLKKPDKAIILILFGYAYDVTEYAYGHPGGVTVLWNSRGKESGETFMRIHGLFAKKEVGRYLIGRVVDAPPTKPSPLIERPQPAAAAPSLATAAAAALASGGSTAQGTPYEIARRNAGQRPSRAPLPQAAPAGSARHRTRVLTQFFSTSSKQIKYFSFASPERLPLLPGGHVRLLSDPATGEGKFYSPYRVDETDFYVALKLYPGGVTSSYLFSRKMGDEVLYEGPFPPAWLAAEDAVLQDPSRPPAQRHVLLLAGGTGTCPMYSIAADLLERQTAHVTLVISVRSSYDFVVDLELQELLRLFGPPPQSDDYDERRCYLTVRACLTKPPPGDLVTWAKFSTGRMDAALLRSLALRPTQAVVVCGPARFNDAVAEAVVQAGVCTAELVHIL